MIAQIIPVKRLPKQLELFDYQVPPELEKKIAIGQLVQIPIRTSQVFGIVFSLAETSNTHHKLKDLSAIIQETPLLRQTDLHRYRIMARWYGIALGTMLKLALLPMQKRKVKKMHLIELADLEKRTGTTSWRQLQTAADEQSYVADAINDTNGQTLILVPETHRLHSLYDSLSEQEQTHCILWHSGLTVKEQFDAWLQIRNGEKDIIIGNRSAVLLPFFNLKKIIFSHEGDDNHKHWDQNPRFHAGDVADLLQKIYGIDIVKTGPVPSVSSYARHEIRLSAFNADLQPRIVDMRGERAQHNYAVFSHSVVQQITEAANNICIMLNRRGYASSLSCQDCGHTQRCHSCELPYIYHESDNSLRCHYCHTHATPKLACTECGSTMVRLRGAGTELIEKQVRELVAEHNLPHKVIRVDAEMSDIDIPEDQPIILVGTQKALSLVDWQKTGLIIFSSLDGQLAIPDYRASDSVWQMIHQTMFAKRADAAFFIQTMNPEHFVFTALADPTRYYEKALAERKALNYAPYKYVARYLIATPREQTSKQAAEAAYHALDAALTKAGKKATVTHPYPLHPLKYRGKYWYAILIKMDPKNWMNDLMWYNQFFSADWRIDPHPISFLGN